jgi:4-diphosphocytidyl-2-C-methyl-D-erythritol kinase
MVTVGLFDMLTFAPADDIRLTCDDPSIPADNRNLVWRAAAALRPADGRGVAMHLAKRIPAGGGLGGGSSNAATALTALNDFWQLGHGRQTLSDVAATLGSDVAFFLHGPSSVCTGRGEIVTPVPPPPCGWAVLILPGIAMPTPLVYRRLDELRRSESDAFDLPAEPLPPAADAAALLPRLVNDLERPAFDVSPELRRLRETAERHLGRIVRMSGSGSTLFTLFDTETEAQDAADRVATLGVKAMAVTVG